MYFSVYSGVFLNRIKRPTLLGAMRYKPEHRRLPRFFQSTRYKLARSKIAMGLRHHRSRFEMISYGAWTCRKDKNRLERAASRMITGEPRR